MTICLPDVCFSRSLGSKQLFYSNMYLTQLLQTIYIVRSIIQPITNTSCAYVILAIEASDLVTNK